MITLLLRLIFILPVVMLKHIPPRYRVHPRYSWHQATFIVVVRWFLEYQARYRPVTPQPLGPESGFPNDITIHPSAEKMYMGPLDDGEIRPTSVRATWYPRPPPPPDSISTSNNNRSKVILHFHGGAYVVGSSHPTDSGFMAKKLLQHNVAPHALFLDYRLSCTPQGRFPAALQDAVSAYVHLLGLGYSSDNVIVSGDSAGGHLAIGFLRYLSCHPTLNLPEPRIVLLWSPWIDVSKGYDDPTRIMRMQNFKTDYIPVSFIMWGAHALVPKISHIVDVKSPYISFLGNPFATKSRVWVHAGALELLYPEIVEFVDQMAEVEGNEISLCVSPYANHDILETGHMNGFGAEVDRILEVARAIAAQGEMS
ncbi:hypothetical protein AYO21_03280 [Fonsecaea monophora]|uniref:Alpha/beta hydrolase fold-3 domain-containing protein n=1 Tax=Fonsecaea monophora TaxID=254056 RepID=A0A177FDL4_9EURO|nr:hypothetical protein AYO21_03280 [Fonsecaea monophora]KAH0843005.1 hypothetical protein FOPE_08187 [Fonsecaea pedrosoi]OAG42404.1 hypothetical protein AYO21_03280 [Fonsecaea monophora]